MNATDQYTEDGAETYDGGICEVAAFVCEVAAFVCRWTRRIGIPALLICGIAGLYFVAGCLSQIVN